MVDATARSGGAPRGANFSDRHENASFFGKLATRLARDYPLIWSKRLDFPIAFALVGSFVAILIATFRTYRNEEDFIEPFLILLLVCVVATCYWIYLTSKAVAVPYGPALKRFSAYRFTVIAALVLYAPHLLYTTLSPFYFPNIVGDDLEDFPGLLSWTLVLVSFTIAVVNCLGRVGFQAVFSALFGVIVVFGALSLLLVFINSVIGLDADPGDFRVFVRVAALSVAMTLGLYLFLRFVPLAGLARDVAQSTTAICVSFAFAGSSLIFLIELLSIENRNEEMEIFLITAGSFLAFCATNQWITNWAFSLSRAPTTQSFARRDSADGRQALSRIARYKETLARDYPFVFSFRLDLVAAFVLFGLIIVALASASVSDVTDWREALVTDRDDVEQRLFLLYQETGRFGSYYSDYPLQPVGEGRFFSPELMSYFADGAIGGAGSLHWVVIALTCVFWLIWVFNISNVVSIISSPQLNRFSDLLTVGICVFAIATPSLYATYAFYEAVDDSVEQALIGMPASAAYLAGAGMTIRPNLAFDGPSDMFNLILASASLGAAVTYMVRRAGLLDGLFLAAYVALGIVAAFLIGAVLFSDDDTIDDVAVVGAAAFMVAAVLVPNAVRTPLYRRLIFLPALAGCTALTLNYGLASALDHDDASDYARSVLGGSYEDAIGWAALDIEDSEVVIEYAGGERRFWEAHSFREVTAVPSTTNWLIHFAPPFLMYWASLALMRLVVGGKRRRLRPA